MDETLYDIGDELQAYEDLEAIEQQRKKLKKQSNKKSEAATSLIESPKGKLNNKENITMDKVKGQVGFTRIKYDDHTDWLELRKSGIGGSDAAAIVGLSQWSSPLEVYCQKKGLVPPLEDNESMRQGRDLEAYVAERFCEATEKKVRQDNHILQSIKYPFMHGSIDRKIVGENAGLECKTTSVFNKTDFEGGSIPNYYYTQCQHYMAVTGYDRWYLAVVILSKGFYWFKVERNEEDIQALVEMEQAFWENHILAGVMPAPTEQDSDVIKELYPTATDGCVVDIESISDTMTELVTVKASKKELEAKQKELENVVKLQLGDAEVGVCDGFSVTYKNRLSSRLDSKELKKEKPEIYEEYVKQSQSRTLLIKEAV